MTLDAYLVTIKQHRLKATPKRRALIELFLKKGRYLGPQEVWSALKARFGRLGLPTVYRILEELSAIGVLIKVRHDNRRLYYTLCQIPAQDHHHFVCRKCRRVEEVEFCNFAAVARFIERRLNGKPETHFFQVEGLCCNCKKTYAA